MKKLLIAVLAALMIMTVFAGCYDPLADPNRNTTPTASGETASTEPTTVPENTTYTDNLDGLRDYLKDAGYLTVADDNGNMTAMKAELIGAKEGRKYTNNSIVIELYYYDLSGTNETRDSFIESVKTNGYFTLYDKNIPAYLSDSGEFLMVYTNSDIKDGDTSSDAYKTMQSCIRKFRSFKPED